MGERIGQHSREALFFFYVEYMRGQLVLRLPFGSSMSTPLRRCSSRATLGSPEVAVLYTKTAPSGQHTRF